jgi:hypothetical protein
MDQVSLTAAMIEAYRRGRPRWMRWREWLRGRRFRLTGLADQPRPLIVIAHSFRDAAQVGQLAEAVESDWVRVPNHCRELYAEVLQPAPGLLVVQFRRSNVCGCLGHRHVLVKEGPFAEPHEAFGGLPVGEIDIAYERVASWQPLPLTDTALDAKFFAGSRFKEFHAQQFRLRLLSVLLHEINHLVSSQAPERSVRERSLTFYREALASYVEEAVASLSLTIDRSFSRFD